MKRIFLVILRANRLLQTKQKKQGKTIVPLGPYTFHRQKRIKTEYP